MNDPFAAAERYAKARAYWRSVAARRVPPADRRRALRYARENETKIIDIAIRVETQLAETLLARDPQGSIETPARSQNSESTP